MELTVEQRAELVAIRERAIPDWNLRQYQRHARPKGKEPYDDWQRKLDTLATAWRKIDSDTQTQLLVTIVREWTDDGQPGVPDLARIIEDMKAGVVLPSGQQELPGLRAAVLHLWNIWCAQQLVSDVSIASAARSLALPIADTYGLNDADARRLVGNKLQSLAADGWLPCWPTARDEVKGATSHPFP